MFYTITLSNDDNISADDIRFESVVVDVFSVPHIFIEYKLHNNNENYYTYHPKTSCIVYYNSYTPDIRIECLKDEKGLNISICGSFMKVVRILEMIFIGGLCLIELFLVFLWAKGLLEYPFVLIAVLLVIAFEIVFSRIAATLEFKKFVREYKKLVFDLAEKRRAKGK